MAKTKKVQAEDIKSKPQGRDIITEMFEHFGIKVIDVTNGYPKPYKKKTIK